MNIGKLEEEIEKEYRRLAKMKESAVLKLKSIPEGKLETKKRNGKISYYCFSDGKTVYIKDSDIATVKALQERKYYTNLLRTTEKETEALSRILGILKKTDDADNVFISLPYECRNLIEPYVEMYDQKEVKNFESQKIINRAKNSTYITKTGVHVRSKSELIIADRLTAAGVPYVYEPIMIMNELIEIWKPDFEVLNTRLGKKYYWEHFGMLDNHEYCDSFQYKMERYAEIDYYPGENLIVTTESSTRPLSTKQIDRLITKYLK